MKCPFRAALMRSIRGYHIHRRTDRADASVEQFHDIGTASSSESEVLTLVPPICCPITFDDEQLLTRGLAYGTEKFVRYAIGNF